MHSHSAYALGPPGLDRGGNNEGTPARAAAALLGVITREHLRVQQLHEPHRRLRRLPTAKQVAAEVEPGDAWLGLGLGLGLG